MKWTWLKSSSFVLALVLTLALNIFSVISLPFKLDLSANKTFSLSPATKKVLTNLDDIVTIKIFSSSTLPPRFVFLRQNLKDLLAEYQWLAKNKLRIEWLYPDKNKELEEEAQRLGIPPLQFQTIEQEKFQVTQGYFGLVILFEDKKEVIPVLEDNANLEYQLTSTIRKISNKEKVTVGLVSGHGELWQERTPFQNEPLVSKTLSKEFLVENLTLGKDSLTLVPDSFGALIVAGPKEAYDEKSLFALDQYILAGKPVLFFLDGVTVDEKLQAEPAKHQLFDLLKSYGLELKTNLVLDFSAGIANFNDGLTTFFVPYPYWPKITAEGINQKNPATFGLQGLVIPWASSISFPENDERYTVLISSSPKSWTIDKNYNLNPTQKWQPAETKSQTLAVLFDGKLTSAFKNKTLPKEFKGEFKSETDKAKILLVGDSDMLSDGIAAGFTPNLHFLLNLTEFMTSSENLAQIQVKQQEMRPLKPQTPQQIEIIKYGSILGLPLLVGLIGMAYLYWHKNQVFKI